MPPVELWVQYSLIGIIFLVTVSVAGGFYKLWKDLLVFFERQNGLRDAEREKQREWEERQSKIRDERWQAFISAIQANAAANDLRTADVLERLVSEVQTLTSSLNEHDTYVRAKHDAPTRPLRNK